MQRRDFLAGLVAMLAIGNWLGRVATAGYLPEWDPASTEAAVAIGNQSSVDDQDETRPHTVVIWNVRDDARSISVRVDRERDGGSETVFDRQFDVPGDGAIQVELVEPASYRVAIGAAGTPDVHELRETKGDFDCNYSTSQVFVLPADGIQSVYVTTLAECVDLNRAADSG